MQITEFLRNGLICFAPLFYLLPLFFCDEYFTGLRAAEGPDDSAFLHFVDDTGGPGIAKLQASLQYVCC